MAPGVYPSAREAWRQGRAPLANSIWQKTSTTRQRLSAMRGLRAIGLGFNCDEDYVQGLVGQGRVARKQGKDEQGIINLAMERKISDQRDSLRGLKDQQGAMRGEISENFGGGTMAYRRSLRKLKRVGRAMDGIHGPRLSQKVSHLQMKHRKPLQERGTPDNFA